MPDRLWPALWTHLDVPGVEPADIVAERAIRPSGARGVSARSPVAARGLPVPLPVAATCRMHGLDLFDSFAGVCTASMADLARPQCLAAPA